MRTIPYCTFCANTFGGLDALPAAYYTSARLMPGNHIYFCAEHALEFWKSTKDMRPIDAANPNDWYLVKIAPLNGLCYITPVGIVRSTPPEIDEMSVFHQLYFFKDELISGGINWGVDWRETLVVQAGELANYAMHQDNVIRPPEIRLIIDWQQLPIHMGEGGAKASKKTF